MSVFRALALSATVLALAARAGAEDLAALRHARALADELMSPFCPGRTLSDCPSPNAAALREEIRTWVAEGRSDAEIRAQLRSQFGDVLAAEPESIWGRIAPLGAIALVAILFGFGVRRVLARPSDLSP